MTLYSHNGNWPTQLPNRIYLSNGKSRTDKTTFTADELADAGWIAVSNPPNVTYPNKLDWDGVNWLIRQPNENETSQRWVDVRNQCTSLLAATDYKVLKRFELGLDADLNLATYRQALRDIYNNVNNIDPWHVPWPTYPDEDTI